MAERFLAGARTRQYLLLLGGAGRRGSLFRQSEIADNHPVITQEVDAGCMTSARTYVANLCDGAGVGYKYLAFSGAERTVELEVRGDLAGVVSVRLDAPDGAELTRRARARRGLVHGGRIPDEDRCR